MPRKPKKESIRIKLSRAVLYPLVLLAVILGATGIVLVNRLAKEDAARLLTQACEKEALRIDNRLNLVQHSVFIIDEYIRRTNAEEEYPIFSEAYEERIREFAITVSNQTDSAAAVYYRFNPELVGSGTGGFFWSKPTEGAAFAEQPPTDILKYNASDIEHVGWFYTPKEAKTPLWMKPYYNQNLKVFMISYVIPVYSEKNEFLGVVGMDIDFNSIMTSERSVVLYETGTIALANLSDHLIYGVQGNSGSYSAILPQKLYNHITTINKDSDILEVTEEDGTESVICCRRLTNGMMLFVNVPKQEIYRSRDQLTVFTVVLTAVILGLAAFGIQRQTNRILEPINRLAEVTGNFARGEWSHKYVCETGDELQNLSESVEIMAKNTQEYLAELSSLARTDSLTGLENKTSYLEHISGLQQGKFEAYGLVILDLNLLKKANDTYGHEAGDALLREASRYIRSVFSHSPAFRIGGDEFAVLLTGEDYANRQALCARFEQGMPYDMQGLPGIRLSVSYGMAVCPEEAAEFDALARLADERMYAKKKEMKQKGV